MTLSAVDERGRRPASPWTEAPPLRSLTPVLRGADRLRRSLIPSLLDARQTNEALSNAEIELFEIAKIYLPSAPGCRTEQRMLGLTSGRDFAVVRGVIEAMVAPLNPAATPDGGTERCGHARSGRRLPLVRRRAVLGYVGQIGPEATQARSSLRGPTIVAEVKLDRFWCGWPIWCRDTCRSRLIRRSPAI